MAGRFANLEFTQRETETVAAARQHTASDDLTRRYQRQAIDAERWGRHEEALRLYTRALQEDRTLIPAWVGQVRMLVQLDECHEARVWTHKALELFQNQGELLAAEAQAVCRLGDHKAALALSDASIQAEGESPWRWQVRGEVLLARRDRFAGECFDRSIHHATADWFDRVIVARIYQYYGQFSNALHYLREALALEPAHACAWLLSGQCQVALGQSAQAQVSYETALGLCPEWQPACQALDGLAGTRPLFTRLRALLLRWSRR